MEEECRGFEQGLHSYGKDFSSIQANKVLRHIPHSKTFCFYIIFTVYILNHLDESVGELDCFFTEVIVT